MLTSVSTLESVAQALSCCISLLSRPWTSHLPCQGAQLMQAVQSWCMTVQQQLQANSVVQACHPVPVWKGVCLPGCFMLLAPSKDTLQIHVSHLYSCSAALLLTLDF